MSKAATALLGLGYASTAKAKSSHDRREPSGGAYTMFNPQQVRQFKEAFNMIDQDGDGRITEGDLRTMLSNLGQTPTSDLLSRLLASHGPAGLNFTQYLTLMSDRLIQLDREDDILHAFACFDDSDSGFVDVKEMRGWLATIGDRMGGDEIDRLFSGPFTDRQGRFNYVEWAKMLRVNDGEPEREDRLAI